MVPLLVLLTGLRTVVRFEADDGESQVNSESAMAGMQQKWLELSIANGSICRSASRFRCGINPKIQPELDSTGTTVVTLLQYNCSAPLMMSNR